VRQAFAAISLIALVALCACSNRPPAGKWEGGTEQGGIMVAARVEIGQDGRVKISAPDITNAIGSEELMMRMRQRLAADLASGWDGVAPRPFDFDGKIFRKPGGIAPQMEWDKSTGQMTLELYMGARPAMPVLLRPVDAFHDNPWSSG